MAYHDEYIELISAAMDGALSPDQQAELEAHLSSCPDCKALYDDLMGIHQALQAMPTVAVPEGLTDRIMAAVQADNVTPLPVKKPAFQWKRWAATAAVLALILAGAGGMRLLTRHDVMTPATGEMPTPEASDPAMARSLPVPTQDEASGDATNETVDDQTPTAGEDTPPQGSGIAPNSTAEPTSVPVQPTPGPGGEVAPITVPSQSPEEAPANYMGNSFTPVPVMTVPPQEKVTEDPGLAVQSISLEPDLTEEDLYVMEQIRLFLELPEDCEWSDGTLRWTTETEVLRLVYTGIDAEENGTSWGRFELWAAPHRDGSQSTLRAICEVPVDGGEILVSEPLQADPDLS